MPKRKTAPFKYPKVKAGQKVKLHWPDTALYMACCDCDLVHAIKFDVKGEMLTFRAWRDNKETARLRKKDKIVLK